MKATKTQAGETGLGYWMERVIHEADKAARDMNSDAVHDLRVALRRCRSLADGFRAIDPDKAWKKMRRQATELFDSLGELRDCHVMQEWVEKLGEEGEATTRKLMDHGRGTEQRLEQQTKNAIEDFDRPKWNALARRLAQRSARLHPGSEVFQSLALERWTSARRMEPAALRTGAPTALHRLRIALKKFRYLVENFLPEHHGEWSSGLKEVQDLLGDIHDLDVLAATAQQAGGFADEETQKHWHQRIRQQREARLKRYKELMTGLEALWKKWRKGLPRGVEARRASVRKLQAWTGFLDSDIRHSRRVARFALRLHDGLVRTGVLKTSDPRGRELLQAAALVHEVGRAEGERNHHKKTERMIGGMDKLPGWSRSEVETMARIARYHRGGLPRTPNLQDLLPAQRQTTKMLAGILRLANALDADHEGSVRAIKVAKPGEFVVIYAEGLQPQSSLAETVAAARHLLETTCGLPILVKPFSRRTRRNG